MRIERSVLWIKDWNIPLYPRRLRARKSVERIVINSSASLALGTSKMTRHSDIATLFSKFIRLLVSEVYHR